MSRSAMIFSHACACACACAGAGRPSPTRRRGGRDAAAALLLAAAALPAPAALAVNAPNEPLFLKSLANPNVFVVLDTSQSMDATMAGRVIAGSDASSRSTLARDVLRDVIRNYRHDFNWGLGSFAFTVSSNDKPQPLTTYAYYLGDASTMSITSVCTDIVDGIGKSNKTGTYMQVRDGVETAVTGLLPCVANPQRDTTNANDRTNIGANKYVTFSRSSDNANINDAFFASESSDQIYGVGAGGGSSYTLLKTLNNFTAWTGLAFTANCAEATCGARQLDPTDSGFVPDAVAQPRAFFVKRAFGYDRLITGAGRIDAPVVKSSGTTSEEIENETVHHNKLLALLATEDASDASAMLKNAAQRTPLAGSLQTTRDYFANAYASTGKPTPIDAAQTCQRNYVVLATDGNPTAKENGTDYTSSQVANTRNSDGSYTFGTAASDVFAKLEALRSTSYNGKTYDVQTYVVGLGDSVANASSVAALNQMAVKGGTGAAYLATSQSALTSAFQSIASKIESTNNAASSVALSTTVYREGARVFQPTFDPSTWTGNLLAYPIDSAGLIGATPAWRAAETVSGQNWNTGRTILTYKPSSRTGIAFRAPVDAAAPTELELDPIQINLLNANPLGGAADNLGALRVAFLRGQTDYEARNRGADATPRFRDRVSKGSSGATVSNVLGDIVDSAPLYVGAPSQNYRADFQTSSYPAFARDQAGRTPYVYVGANDGMLHAFRADTGVEKFAYVPNLVFPSLGALTLPTQSFVHRFNVDGAPAVADVFYASGWHSLLVSGLRSGGRGLFALDVTNPDGVTEARAASVVRWEFPNASTPAADAAAIGQIYAKPLMKKTNNGQWSVIVGNGYNASGSSTAQLLVLNAETGAVVRRLDTGSGTSDSPNGLSAAVAYDTDANDVIDVVYAGDLNGNLWKFDLSAPNPADWSVGIGGAPLFAAGSAKPITAAPDVTRHPNGGVIVAFGTGRYLGNSDLATTGTQTAYGIWDNGSGTAVTADQLQSQKIEPENTELTVSGVTMSYRLSTHRVGPPTDRELADDVIDNITRRNFLVNKRGWFVDLPSSGERIVTDAKFSSGRAVFSTLTPTTDPCYPDGTTWDLNFDPVTGNRPDATVFDVNRDRSVNSGDLLTTLNAGSGSGTNAATTSNVNGAKIDFALSGLAAMRNGDLSLGIANTVKGTTSNVTKSADPSDQIRIMWRVVE